MLGDLLHETAARAPDGVAFVDGARRLTYAEWDWLSDRVAFSLWDEGLRPGDAVALLLQPSLAYPIAYLGAAKIGCVTAGVNPRHSPREIDEILDDSLARALVTDDAARAGPGVFSPDALMKPGGAPPSVEVADTDAVAIVYTSGTTGTPKGAVFTQRALDAVRRIEAASDGGDGGAPARGIQSIPMAHMGFMTKIGAFVARASTAVLMRRWSAREALELLERERLTRIGGVPTQLALMLREPAFATTDLGALRQVVVGGAPASPELVRAIREGFGVPVVQRYSCTELAMCTSTRPEDDDEIVARTVGRAQPEVDLLVAHPNADGIGEILARSPAMFSGYRRARDAAAATDEHGYFHTGDLGRVDARGNLVLAGRAKEMFIRGGYNVYPLEVENALQSHPKVARAAVVGVADDVLGERGRAYVEPRDADDPPDARELEAFIAEHIARFKLPDEYVMRARLPLTPMFKVDKRALETETATEPHDG
jgi:acyl-CoA synthetase (AMP-forming)/AMP-acid ligase II